MQHEVVLTKPFYVGVTEVTNAQYRRFRADQYPTVGFRTRTRALNGDTAAGG